MKANTLIEFEFFQSAGINYELLQDNAGKYNHRDGFEVLHL